MPQPRAPTDAEPVIATLSDVHVRYGKRTVLAGLTLSLKKGEIYALLGQNGSGKTTLMRVLSGQILPVSGEVRVLGLDPRKEPQCRQSIGLVPQDIALYPRLTVRENLEVMGGMYSLPKQELPGRVEEAMALTQVESRQSDLVEQLSGGYRRRANIAAALLTRPRLLLLDEPMAGVDIEARLSLFQALRRLRDGGTSILITTHDLDQAQALSDRIGILASGRLVEEGPVGEVLDRMLGSRRQLTVSLRREPNERTLAVLRHVELAPTSNPLEWVGWRTDFESLGELQSTLQQSGIDIREVRLGEPGLEHILARFAGGKA